MVRMFYSCFFLCTDSFVYYYSLNCIFEINSTDLKMFSMQENLHRATYSTAQARILILHAMNCHVWTSTCKTFIAGVEDCSLIDIQLIGSGPKA